MRYFKYIITILFVDGINSSFRKNMQTFPVSASKDITRLSLTGNDFPLITRRTFHKYKELEELNLINCGVVMIDNRAFYDLVHLKKFRIENCLIKKLNSNIFPPNNSLQFLLFPNNMLNNLDDFDINYFPKLTIFDISNNKMRSLPKNLLNKLENNDNFTMIIHNNPWNCLNKNWTSLLNEKLFLKFCSSHQSIKDEPTALELKKDVEPCFIYCSFWFFGVLWFSIILVNLCLIRKILFKRYEGEKTRDQATQCEFLYRTTSLDAKKQVTIFEVPTYLS